VSFLLIYLLADGALALVKVKVSNDVYLCTPCEVARQHMHVIEITENHE